MFGLILAQAAIDKNAITPNPSAIPGSTQANTLLSGLMYFSLIFCVVGLILSAGLWAVGAFSNNYTQSVNGKKGFLVCAGAALAIGAAVVMVNFFYKTGNGVQDTSGA